MVYVVYIMVVLLPGFILFVLFARIAFIVNSESKLFRISMARMIDLTLIAEGVDPCVSLRIFTWKRIFPLTGLTEKGQQGKRTDEVQKRSKAGMPLHKILKVLKSFRVSQCEINIDTGNLPLNGFLFSWVYLLRMHTGYPLEINFNGENLIKLRIENTMARMLWAYVKS